MKVLEKDSSPFALRVLIVEDDFSFALELRMLIEKLGYQCLEIFESGEEAFRYIEKSPPDAILMDIDLKGTLSGIELAEQIKSLEIPILFLTSYSDNETYQRALDLKMIGFLVKPLNEITLLTAINACMKEVAETAEKESLNVFKDALIVKKGSIYHKIKLTDIYYLGSELEYVVIYTDTQKFIIRESLKNLLNLLPQHLFVKSHQRYILSLKFVDTIDKEECVAKLKNGTSVPISRRNRKLIEGQWKNFSAS